MSMLAYQNRRVLNDLDRGAPAAMSVRSALSFPPLTSKGRFTPAYRSIFHANSAVCWMWIFARFIRRPDENAPSRPSTIV
jgi:hypothetical protein